TVAEYVMAVNQATGQGAAASATTPRIEPRQMPKQEMRRPPLPIILVAALLLVGGGGMLGWRFYVRGEQSRAAQAPLGIPAVPLPSSPSADSSAVAPPLPPFADSAPSSAAGGPATPSSDKLVLKIEAGKATSATVTADGQVVFG